MANDLTAVGIRVKVRPMERAAAFAAHREKTFKHLAFHGSGAFGNTATRLGTFVYSKGAEAWIKDPEIDAWYEQQAGERDRTEAPGLAAQDPAETLRRSAFYAHLGAWLPVCLRATGGGVRAEFDPVVCLFWTL